MPFNPNTHKRKSIRLPEYDYAQEGAYFITICTHERECLFGEIENGKMILSSVGTIADVMWYEIKNHRSNVELGDFVVMPNHIHGIIIITENFTSDDKNTNDVGARLALPNNEKDNALQKGKASLAPTNMSSLRFQNQGKNTLSSIVGAYKSSVSKHAHRLNFSFAWQRNYFEHIIRDEKSHRAISEYIMENPEKWTEDRFYVK